MVKSRPRPRPPLLHEFSTSEAGYDLTLTDLTHIWHESLSLQQVIDRAAEEESAIDPGDDTEQFRLLLGKLRDALQGHEGCHLSLHSRDDAGQRLFMKACTPLPEPFEPLRWTFVLRQLSLEASRERVVAPVLAAARLYMTQVTSLEALLKDKDWAIGKLLDKLETFNIDLNSVFPGQRFVRSAPTSHVRGMSRFDEQRWAQQFESMTDARSRCGESIVQCLKDVAIADEVISATASWWRYSDDDAQGREQQTQHQRDMAETARSRGVPTSPVTDSSSTRRRLRSPGYSKASPPAGAHTGESEGGSPRKRSAEEVENSSASEHDRRTPVRKPLGRIGGPRSRDATPSKARKESQSQSPENMVYDRPSPQRSQGQTRAEALAQNQSTTPTSHTRKRGIGVLGGPRSEPQVKSATQADTDSASETTSTESRVGAEGDNRVVGEKSHGEPPDSQRRVPASASRHEERSELTATLDQDHRSDEALPAAGVLAPRSSDADSDTLPETVKAKTPIRAAVLPKKKRRF
ncbi:hypothetical protein KEM52_001443 [Ascosphaera acerosa]|nr:hypothetical protein KEM52_001443 [Ascosphaera acerosa]